MFDAQVVLSPKDSPRGKLMEHYVLARIIRLDDVDLGLFDYDRNNTLYYFIMNADEQIYMRYGGRDPAGPDTYLNLSSIELALAKGLELHKQYQAGRLAKTERPKPVFAREFPLLVERTFAKNNCVECHLVGDFQNQHRELDGKLDKPVHLYRSPDIKNIGIVLDVPKGLVVKEAKGAVEAAGMKPGDRIAAVNGIAVWTFGDLQHWFDKTPRDATQAKFTVDRAGQSVDLAVKLPERWWVQDVRWRQSSVDPRVYFDSRPLTAGEKTKHGFDPAGFASEVTHVDMFADIVKSHSLKAGDIIFAVDGVQRDRWANTAELFIKLNKKSGSDVTLDVLRGSERIKMPLKTFRMSFRK